MGRRWGKTTMCKSIALAVAANGGKVGWVVPQYKNGRSVWRDTESTLALLRKAKKCEINRAERTATFSNGGFFGIYSADNADSIRSEWFHLVVADEAARIDEGAYTDVIMPTLADVGGSIIMPSTPKGQNWFYKEWLRGKARMNEEQAAFTAPSAANPSPMIRAAALAAKERVSDRTYRQEWLAEFIPDGGEVFRNVDAASKAIAPQAPLPNHVYVAGLDWGQEVDFTVLSIFDATEKQQVALYAFNGMDWTPQRARIREYCKLWNVHTLKPEFNSIGNPNVEELRKEFAADGIDTRINPFTTTNQTKAEAVEAFALALETGRVKLLDHEEQKAQLKSYDYTRTPQGNIKYGAPSGMHDDIVMADLMAWDEIVNYRSHGGIHA